MFLTHRFVAAFVARTATLPILAGIAVAALVPIKPAEAQRFNPNTAAPSLGAFPQTAGTYTFNTTGVTYWTPPSGSNPGMIQTVPYVIGPNGYFAWGTVKNGCALFNFDVIAVSASQHLVGTGGKPLVLLSKSTVLVYSGGTISVAGGAGTSTIAMSDGPFASSGGAGGAGAGNGGDGYKYTTGGPNTNPTAGGNTGGSGAGTITSSGAGFYGVGGAGSYSSTGGPSYGTAPSVSLMGGSGAGGTMFAGGGGGGGALEISAVQGIYIYDGGASAPPAISAAGGRGNTGHSYLNVYSVSGGGSGGTIYLTAPAVYAYNVTNNTFNVRGGGADWYYYQNYVGVDSYYGGPGAGGRMRVEYTNAPFSSSTTHPWVASGTLSPIPFGQTAPTTGVSNGELVIAPLTPYTP